MALRRFPAVAVALVVVGVLALGPGILAPPRAQARDISGNTYTSPQFGYTLTWDNTWLVIDETSEELDAINLTNGLSFVALIGMEAFAGSGQLAATLFASGVTQREGISDYAVVEAGGDDSRYRVTVSYTQTVSDGSTFPVTEFVEAQTLIPGAAVVIFDVQASSDFYELAKPSVEALLSALVIPGAAGQAGEPEPDRIQGESGPVFMAGPWRVAVESAAHGAAMPGVGLKEKEGKEWVVVVADVTNWGSSNPAFPVEDFFVQMAQSDTRHRVATGSTASVGRELDLPGDPGAVEIGNGETERLVMVFSVNADRTGPTLLFRNDRLPLDEMLVVDLEPDELGEPAGPPELQEGELVSVSADGSAVQVQYAGESRAHRVRLLGVDAAETPDAVVDLLMEYEGETVWIETDAALEETATPTVYLWVENEHGDRVLLNQLLIEEGAAPFDALPDEARFAIWLQATADAVDQEN